MCLRHHKELVFVAVALISASCMSQQVQERSPGSTSVPPLGVSASENSPPVAAAPFPRTDPPSQLASDSGEPAPIILKPALRGILPPNPEPDRRGPVLRSLFGQRADVGLFTVGNFNPSMTISIQNTPHTAISLNKSSMGGGAEYRRWFSDRSALSLLYVQNPSDGKLLWQGQSYIWPQMRRDFSVLATQRFEMGRFVFFFNAGPGVVVTNGYSNCGWSAGFALVAGLGTDYQLSRRLSARTGVTFLGTRSGCYDDQTCHESWGVVEDLRVGLVYKWGGERSSGLIR
jgi:hypothetical protein